MSPLKPYRRAGQGQNIRIDLIFLIARRFLPNTNYYTELNNITRQTHIRLPPDLLH